MQNLVLSPIDPETLINKIAEKAAEKTFELLNVQGTQSNQKELITRKEVAKLLNVNITTIHRWTERGKLKSYGMGGRVYYKKGEVLDSVKPLK